MFQRSVMMFKDCIVKGMLLLNEDMNKTTYFIGMDGGGTKTECIIGDAEGHILGYAKGASSNISSKSSDDVAVVLRDLIHDVIQQAGVTLQALAVINLTLAGSDRPEAGRTIRAMMEGILPSSCHVRITSDAASALAAGVWGDAGIILIAGTGSIAYAYPPSADHVVRVGGWGYLLGDEGSGYDIGRAGLNAALRDEDGRGPQTLLTQMALQHYHINQTAELIGKVYTAEHQKAFIAGFSYSVLTAAADGDDVAVALVEDAVSELWQLLKAVLQKVDEANEALPLVITGGLFKSDYFKHVLKAKLNKETVVNKCIYPDMPPVVGAYILALQRHEKGISDDMKACIKRSWQYFS